MKSATIKIMDMFEFEVSYEAHKGERDELNPSYRHVDIEVKAVLYGGADILELISDSYLTRIYEELGDIENG